MDRSKWEYKKLSDVSEIIMGQSPSSDSYNEEGNGLPASRPLRLSSPPSSRSLSRNTCNGYGTKE